MTWYLGKLALNSSMHISLSPSPPSNTNVKPPLSCFLLGCWTAAVGVLAAGDFKSNVTPVVPCGLTPEGGGGRPGVTVTGVTVATPTLVAIGALVDPTWA